MTHGGRGRAPLLSFICPEHKVTANCSSPAHNIAPQPPCWGPHGPMATAGKWIKGSTGQLLQHTQSPCGREATNLKMPEMGLYMRQHEWKPHTSHHGQEQGVLPAFRLANPAQVPRRPQDEKGTDKGKEEEKCTRIGKIRVPYSSSHTKAAKTCREGKKLKQNQQQQQKRIAIS